MVTKKKVKRNPEVQTSEQVGEPTADKFSKLQILASARFGSRRDLVDALLDDKESYTMKQVNELVDSFMKGEVK